MNTIHTQARGRAALVGAGPGDAELITLKGARLLREADVLVYDNRNLGASDGTPRGGDEGGRVIFGPTCDSVDRLPGELVLPGEVQEGDYVIFHGAGAYSVVTNTRFNGFGEMQRATALRLD